MRETLTEEHVLAKKMENKCEKLTSGNNFKNI